MILVLLSYILEYNYVFKGLRLVIFMVVDTDNMYSVRSWAFQGINDPREGLPNCHYRVMLGKLVGEGKLVIVENNDDRDVFKNPRTGAHVVYVVEVNDKGVRERIDVRARGILLRRLEELMILRWDYWEGVVVGMRGEVDFVL